MPQPVAFRQCPPPPRQMDIELSPWLVRILQLLAEGHRHKTCADVLGLTVNGPVPEKSVVPGIPYIFMRLVPLRAGAYTGESRDEGV